MCITHFQFTTLMWRYNSVGNPKFSFHSNLCSSLVSALCSLISGVHSSLQWVWKWLNMHLWMRSISVMRLCRRCRQRLELIHREFLTFPFWIPIHFLFLKLWMSRTQQAVNPWICADKPACIPSPAVPIFFFFFLRWN